MRKSSFTLDGEPRGDAGVAFLLNDELVHREEVPTRYVMHWVRFPAGHALSRAGGNELLVEIVEPGSSGASTLQLTARLHNYYGINPKFPRAYVVLDESVELFFERFSATERAARFSAFLLLSFFYIGTVSRLIRGRPAAFSIIAVIVILWIALAFGLLTSFHLWFPYETVLFLMLVPPALIALSLGIRGWDLSHTLGKVAGVGVVTIVFLEIAFRVLHAMHPVFVFQDDSYNRFRGMPAARYFDTRLNSSGFNDRSMTKDKTASVYRILAIGDSFAFGVVPYDANYLTLLEDDASSHAALDIEVVNFGIPGTAPKDYRDVLVREGFGYAPDLVMVGVFIGNDLEKTETQLYEFSYVATFVRFLWRMKDLENETSTMVSLASDEPMVYLEDAPTCHRNRFLQIEAQRAWIYMKTNPDFPAALNRTVSLLAEMRGIAERAGAGFLVVLIPDEIQVDAGLQSEVARAYGLPLEAFDFELPNVLLVESLAQADIMVLDLLPLFAERSRSERLYKPSDTHWNRAGNRLAAETIGRFVRDRAPLHAGDQDSPP